MPICKLCNSKFKNFVVVDGKIRNLQKRSYCLVCSPFGQHNTRPLIRPLTDKTNQFRSCTTCSRWYTYDCSIGHTRTRCNSCVTRGSRVNIKTRLVEIKDGKCQLCGYNKSPWSLCFHHVDSATKKFGLTVANNSRSWDSILNELEKCVMLCHNCHGEVHAGLVAVPADYAKRSGWVGGVNPHRTR